MTFSKCICEDKTRLNFELVSPIFLAPLSDTLPIHINALFAFTHHHEKCSVAVYVDIGGGRHFKSTAPSSVLIPTRAQLFNLISKFSSFTCSLAKTVSNERIIIIMSTTNNHPAYILQSLGEFFIFIF